MDIDASEIVIQDFSTNLNEKYSGNEFNYHTTEGEAQNFLARGILWLLQGLHNIFGIDVHPGFAKLIEMIIYIILISATIYFLIKLLIGKDAVSFFRKKNTLVAPIHSTEEHIDTIDLNELIKNALQEKNYRLAIRYMYLKALQELSIKNLITYHFEKTNTDYKREIDDVSIRQNFNRISYLYDYIWYGEFELNEQGYTNAKESFDQLSIKIKNIG
ncbi:hypothetical protein GCM10022393_29910 [Aquimarina addita]|uniref:DUF4129 domain-containing protein n=1 Tax=Aquimarina addita TaxID=870485 RepID=A0ABP6US55_9FLAO